MIFENFATCPDLKLESINATINSACGGARRSLKKDD